ncbi:hypothetical protein ACFPTX_17905 [Pseudomonas sp. GCM10022188]|uniref:hypothetical protein n=1 Tax=Pseudomonas TaxID=286 RepID=UPI001E4DCAF1|nr:hypothetical protein [Pseudomonas oryzagri]MCC6076293.1 hypothetical protein [Pseudomonas oryzagri]
MKRILTLCALLGLAGGALAAKGGDAAFRAALAHELDNRALAGQVVGALAEHHRGTPQGRFWAAYVALERYNAPRYAPVAARHGLAGGGLLVDLKAWGSILFARLFPERFLAMLAGATGKYLADMRAVAAPADGGDAAFLAYMIEQESVQASALAQAAAQRYEAAAGELEDFVRRGRQ